jgi:quercetin dioxygenase-like cupin family protein
MAYKNKLISNPRTGQDILFIRTGKETNGNLLEMQTTYNARSAEPVMHYHPLQKEDFMVLSGELTVRIGGKIRILKQGDTLHVPAGTSHAMWNRSGNKTIVNWQVRPALNTEHFLETGMGLANDGKVNNKGMPGILQVSLMANRFANVFRISKPPYIVQRIVFIALTPVAWMRGYRSVYKKYLD